MSSVLVVDDDVSSRRFVSLALERSGYAVEVAENAWGALALLEEEPPDCVLSDLRMPGLSGLELLDRVQERWPNQPFILMSVEEDVRTVVQAVRRGAVNYLLKPFGPERVRDAVAKALQTRPHLPQEPDGALGGILGQTSAMVQLRRAIELAAQSDVNVLISGETGSGKELVARAIHRYSGSSRGPWVAHNCAACPGELFESTLFGHVRGAFSGATHGHVGLLAASDGGTLFLDELQALSTAQQAKLLRVLDRGEVRPVGSTETRHISVRFLAAIGCDAQNLIETGTLRADVYYRLSGFEIGIPPLREHMEDLELLAESFLGRSDGLTEDALALMRSHSWPGNVRELKNVLQGALIRSGKGPIRGEHLDLPSSPRSLAEPSAVSATVTLEEAERALIKTRLSHFGGNRSRAARSLGIDRSTLRRKLREMEES